MKDPSSGFSDLFQVTATITHGDIPMLMALMLGACRLLAMAKDIGGLHVIAIGEVFFQLIVPLSYNFRGRFMNTYPPISLEF
jgi:hypothetical protein